MNRYLKTSIYLAKVLLEPGSENYPHLINRQSPDRGDDMTEEGPATPWLHLLAAAQTPRAAPGEHHRSDHLKRLSKWSSSQPLS